MGTKVFDNALDLITFTRASSGTYLDSDGLLKTASTNVPRIEYDASGAVKGLLVEEARTNLATWSQDFTNAAWVITPTGGVSLVSNNNPSPLGDVGHLYVNDADNEQHRIFRNLSVTAGSAYTFSVFAKAATSNWIYLLCFDGVTTSYYGNFNLAAGTASGVGDLRIEPYGDGWYRCSISFTAQGTGTNYQIHFTEALNTGTNPPSFSGTGKGAVIAGAQLEAGAFPTSYIPTAGATATRAADIASIPVSAFGYNQKAGTVVVEFDRLYTGANGMWAAAISDGTTANMIRVYGISVGSDGFYSSSNGVQGLVSQPTGSMITAFKTMSGAFKQNNVAVIDSVGGTVYSDSSFEMPLNVSVVSIGSNNGGAQLNGHIKSIRYFPRRLSNAQLIEVTS